MTKDDLKHLPDLRDELAVLASDIAKQEELVLKNEENKKCWTETVKMSSTDAACRSVISKVTSRAADTGDEARAKLELRRLRGEYRERGNEYDTLLTEVEVWLPTIGDWRVTQILRDRYVLGMSVREVAETLGYDEGSIRNRESLFWKNK